jgi:hypothetical protein
MAQWIKTEPRINNTHPPIEKGMPRLDHWNLPTSNPIITGGTQNPTITYIRIMILSQSLVGIAKI